jgi:hypothetical protein
MRLFAGILRNIGFFDSRRRICTKGKEEILTRKYAGLEEHVEPCVSHSVTLSAQIILENIFLKEEQEVSSPKLANKKSYPMDGEGVR